MVQRATSLAGTTSILRVDERAAREPPRRCKTSRRPDNGLVHRPVNPPSSPTGSPMPGRPGVCSPEWNGIFPLARAASAGGAQRRERGQG